MILVSAAGRSSRFDASTHVRTLVECDRVALFVEAGWANAAGFSGSDLKLHVHANDAETLRSAFGRAGYEHDGRSLRRMSPERKRAFDAANRTAWDRPR